jgi:hypothetical protein
MLLTNLADLDELVLQVRNQATRVYASEAVTAYRGGAYRASLVALWVAVAFDLVAKLRELAALGDGNAATKVADLDRWIAAQDAVKLQAFERDLLKMAQEEFEFLSPHERTELERLRDDRHLCAHPAFVADDALFVPQAEQVRAYLKSAVGSLLSQQPVQGKAALDRIIADISSSSFPNRASDIESFMRARYLGAAKASLVRNLVIVLLKAVLRDDVQELPSGLYRYTVLRVLSAARRVRPDVYEPVLRDRLRPLISALDDDQLDTVYPLLRNEERAWDWLDDANRLRLRMHLQGRRLRDPGDALVDALEVPQLSSEMARVLDRTENDVLEIVVDDASTSRVLLTHVLTLVAGADNFREAEHRFESLLLPLASNMTDSDVERTLRVVASNDQVWKARRMPRLLVQLFESTRRLHATTRPAWKSFLDQLPPDEDDDGFGADYTPLTDVLADSQ